MKRLFWVNIFVCAVLSLLVSCTTLTDTDKNELASTAITLADKYCTNGEYKKAINVYTLANLRNKDYRFIYNKALILNSTGKTDKALSLCQKGWKKYSNADFLTLRISILRESGNTKELEKTLRKISEAQPDNETYIKDLYETIKISDKARAYNYLLSLWEGGKHTLTIAQMLYNEKPQEWKVTLLALGGKVSENE